MQNNYITPNINNLHAFSYAFRMTFGNNQYNLNTSDHLANTQIINNKQNKLNHNINQFNSSFNS